jgi:hypothetical protein
MSAPPYQVGLRQPITGYGRGWNANFKGAGMNGRWSPGVA